MVGFQHVVFWVSFGIVVGFFFYIGVPWIYGRSTRIIMRRHAFKLKALVLTFDDGPGDTLTPLILDVLAKYNVKATFFVLGRNVKGRESFLREMMAAGHDVCSHGYDHLHYWKVSPWRALADIRKGWESIDIALGRDKGVYPFRPPGGKLNIVCLLFLLFKKVPIVYWTHVSGDTFASKEPQRPGYHLSMPPSKTGVVLAHDFDRTHEDIARVIIDCLGLLLSSCEVAGVQTLTLTQYLSYKDN